MKNLLYASMLVLSVFLTACTSMNSAQKVTSSETVNNSSPNISDIQNPTGACTLQKDSLKDRHESFFFNLFRNKNKDSANKSSIATSSVLSSEKVLTSKEINNALELCGSAQESWEKGKIDKALEYLDAAYAAILDLKTDDVRVNKQKEDLRFMISKRILEIYTSRQTVVRGDHKEIPVTINKYVQREIDRLTGPEKEYFIRSMGRATEYRPFILKELKAAGMPEELSWLPLIESGFRVQALSPARALGLWQFIPSTGYKFGLKRDYYVDERMDPIKSTQAAIKYLSELHKMFGDWSTVLAAYNCGEGRVLRTIRSQNVNYLDNFWDLYEKLPQETASYVPRFIATLHIINNLEKYGLPPQKKIPPLEYQTVTVNKQLRLTDIARKMYLSHTILETLNPELKYGVLPPEEYQLRVPTNTVDDFLASIDDITPSAPVSPKSYSSHKVKSGETLFSIAKNYGITMGELAGANNISKKVTVPAGKELKIPETGFSSNRYTANSNSADEKLSVKLENELLTKDKILLVKQKDTAQSKHIKTDMRPLKYKVKQGDTMWSIARKHNSTPDAIKIANSLSGYTVNENRELIIPQSTTVASSIKTSPAKETKSFKTKNAIASNSENTNAVKIKKSTHWVKSGDTPFTIAQKYNMSVQSLFDLNRLSKSSKIFPGQKLLVK